MTSVNFEEISKRARSKYGHVTEEEIASVITELQDPNTEESRSRLMQVLGYATGPDYALVLEPFLNSRETWLAAKALEVLCLDWDLTAQYMKYIEQFMQGVSWDTYGDCRYTAIGAAGAHLEKHSSPKLLRKLLDTVDDDTQGNDMRHSAYTALRNAMGYEARGVPLVTNFDPQTAIDREVILRAQSRLAEEEQHEYEIGLEAE